MTHPIRHLLLIVTAVAIVVLALVVWTAPAAADTEAAHATEAVAPATDPVDLSALIGMERVAVEPIARGSFPDHITANLGVNLSGGTATTAAEIEHLADIVSAHLTFEPDGFVGWHTHPGPGIVTIVSGALTIVNQIDCVAREYGAGQAFVDVGQGNVHVAYNASGEETQVYAVFLDVPPGDGPTILLEEPGDCS